jgi:hypothetical protein
MTLRKVRHKAGGDHSLVDRYRTEMAITTMTMGMANNS